MGRLRVLGHEDLLVDPALEGVDDDLLERLARFADRAPALVLLDDPPLVQEDGHCGQVVGELAHQHPAELAEGASGVSSALTTSGRRGERLEEALVDRDQQVLPVLHAAVEAAGLPAGRRHQVVDRGRLEAARLAKRRTGH